MGLPFKEAVENFLALKYADRIKKGLTRAEIWREDKRLYRAIDKYQRDYGGLPFDIPSERDLVQRNLEQLYQEGVQSLTPRQRLSLSRLHRRISLEKGKTPKLQR